MEVLRRLVLFSHLGYPEWGCHRDRTLRAEPRTTRTGANTPRAWLLHGAERDELDVPELASRVPGGSTRELPPIRIVLPAAERPQLLVTEGGLPSLLVIGDDNSPFHPQPAWPLT